MSASTKRIIACVLALASPFAVYAQGNGLSVLQEQGEYWQSRGDFKRAAEVWNKVLQIDPDNQQALFNMAQVSLKQQQTERARQYLEHLKRVAPGSQKVVLLEQDLMLSAPANRSALEDARRTAAEGDIDDALPLYRQALDGKEPAGDVGMEYYSYLGYTSPAGMEEAIDGLQRLSAANPDDPRIQLRLARHLARKESTRAQGIRMLEKLSARADIGSDAGESWRDALTWLGSPPRPEFRPLFQSYLAAHPDDQEIRDQLNSQTRFIAQQQQQQQQQRAQQQRQQQRASAAAVVRQDPYADRLRLASQHLEKSELPLAEAQLTAILAERPTHIDAIGTLGVLRMRQGRTQEAVSLLSQAHRAQPANWRQAYATAQYWFMVDQGNQAIASGNYKEAESLFNKAKPLQPKEIGAEVGLARVAIGQSDYVKAERLYRSILQQSPENGEAIAGLVQAYAQSGKVDQARQFVGSLSEKQLTVAGGRPRLQGMYAAGLAQAQRKRGDLASARATLEEALAADPTNAWIRLELAQIYNESGYRREAKGLIDGLLLTDPYNADALYTSAIFATQQNDWQSALLALNRIPPSLMTGEMKAMQRDVTTHARIDYAKALSKQGRRVEAVAVLDELAPAVANDAALMGSVASAYAEAGEDTRALGMIRQEMKRTKTPSTDALLQYAGLLFSTKQDVEAVSVLHTLEGRQLTGQQQSTLRELNNVQAIRQAESLREKGDLVAAYDALAPVLSNNPQDPQGQAALARMYATAGQPEQALGIYQQLLQEDAQNPDLYMGAALVANQSRNFKYADQAVENALALAPDDIDVLTSAAGIYRVQGKTSKAQKLLRHAVALQESDIKSFSASPAASGGQGVPDRRMAANGNPFVGMAGQRGSSTAVQTYVVNGQAQAEQLPAEFAAPAAARMMTPEQAQLNSANPYARAAPAGSAAARELSELEAELAALQQDRSMQLNVGATYRSRTGSKGTSRLEEAQTPIELSFPLGDGKAFVRATPTFIDSGEYSLNRWIDENVQGIRNIVGPNYSFADASRDRAINDNMSTNQTGVGLAVGYELQGVKIDLGVTPLGFKTQNFTGGIAYSGAISADGTVQAGINISSRPVTDSVMSFAGVENPLTGEVTGGVMASGARIDLSKDLGDSGFYGSVGLHGLHGKNVENNRRFETNVGAYIHLIQEVDQLLTTGINLNYVSYSKNLRHFTPGHGGYFSPQNAFTIGVPFSWSKKEGDLTYKIAGSVALQHFKEKAADAFPGFSEAEAQVLYRAMFGDQAMNMIGYLPNSGAYGGQSKTGIAYNLNLAAEYDVTPGMAIGGHIGIDKSGDYRQWVGGLYMKYFFDQQKRTSTVPLAPYSSPYGEPYGGGY